MGTVKSNPNPLHTRIGDRLEARSSSYAELARALGIQRQRLWNLLQKPDELRRRELAAIARFLSVPVGWLFDGYENDPQAKLEG